MADILKLARAKFLLERELSTRVMNLSFEPQFARIKITLQDNTKIYVQYNNHDQYSYSIIFSAKHELDRCRFDNYNKNWIVPDRPNHFHPRMIIDGFKSPMRGIPDDDLPLFCELVIKDKLRDINLRF